jgi:hypothetical protein
VFVSLRRALRDRASGNSAPVQEFIDDAAIHLLRRRDAEQRKHGRRKVNVANA